MYWQLSLFLSLPSRLKIYSYIALDLHLFVSIRFFYFFDLIRFDVFHVSWSFLLFFLYVDYVQSGNTVALSSLERWANFREFSRLLSLTLLLLP